MKSTKRKLYKKAPAKRKVNKGGCTKKIGKGAGKTKRKVTRRKATKRKTKNK